MSQQPAKSDIVNTKNTVPANWALAAMLVAAFLLRMILSPIGGYGYDMFTMSQWSESLYNSPLSEFYAVGREPVHLPGDLWLLYGLAHLFRFLGPILDTEAFYSPTYELFLKALPALGDVGIAVMLYRLLRLLRNARAGLIAAAAFAFNPASIFLTSIWGQWNSVSTALMLVSLELVLRGRWVWATPLWIWAILFKPQMGLIVLLMLIKPIKDALAPDLNPMANVRRVISKLAMEVALSALLAINTLLLLILPFNVGVPGVSMRWSLIDRARYAVDIFPLTTMNAFNLWLFIHGDGIRPPDTEFAILGLDAKTWGLLLLVAVFALVVLLAWLRWQPEDQGPILIWAALCITMAAFVLPTRVHERYMFPALVLAILLAGMRQRGWWIAGGLSVTFLCNLLYVYVRNNPTIIDGTMPTMASQEFLRIVSLANILMLGVMLSLWKSFPRMQPPPQHSSPPVELSPRNVDAEPDYPGHSAL